MAENKKSPGLRGELNAAGLRFGIVVSQFNSFITDRLLAGALDALERAGAGEKQIEIVRVPGSFEIPLAAKKLAATGRFDSLICIALRLRGVRNGARHSARPARFRRAHGFLRPHLRHA
jgi:6,7-dimethyl-8-ribityllumazine synthase